MAVKYSSIVLVKMVSACDKFVHHHSDVPIVYHHLLNKGTLPLIPSPPNLNHLWDITQTEPCKLMPYHSKIALPLLLLLATAHALLPSTSVPLQTTRHIQIDPITAKANSSVPYLLTPPSSLSSTASVRALTGKHCSPVEVQPVLGLGTTVELPIDSQQMAGTAWMTQFMSFSSDPERETLSALIDNGSLLVWTNFSLSVRSLPQQQIYHYGSVDAKDTWLTQHHQLLQLQNELFLFCGSQLDRVTLHQEGYWTRQPFAKDLVSAKVQGQSLILVSRTSVSAYSWGETRQVRVGGHRLQDYLQLGDATFLLDLQEGLLEIKGIKETAWEIEGLEYAVALRGVGNTLMVLYQYRGRNFIGQFFRGTELTLNRYYHSQPEIRDIHLGPLLGVLDCYNEYVVFQHSINRHSFETLAMTDRLYVSRGQGIAQIQMVNLGSVSSYLIASKSQIQHLSLLGLGPKQSLQTVTLSCSSNQTATESILAQFQGPCSDPSFPPQQYACSVQLPATVEFQYVHVRKSGENEHTRLITWLCLGALVLTSLVLCVVCRKKMRATQLKCKQDYDRLLKKRTEGKQQMESTFNKDVIE